MSPIIELQRRMVEAGRIRAGDKGDKGQPQKLAKWRLTSKDRQRLDQAATLWGGEVSEWEGQWQLYTETDALPIMLLPGQEPTTWYELWSKGGCQRRCDGVHEQISDSSCLCGEDRECKPTTRLSVLLPDLPGIGSWLLSSTGWNAAAELAGAADLLQRASAQGVLIPARLRLEQRVSVSNGQTRRFAVPVIDLDVSFRELLGTQGALGSPTASRALPSGYVPVPAIPPAESSIADSLAEVETRELRRTTRSAAPIAEVDIEFGPAPVPPSEDPPPPEPEPSPSPDGSGDLSADEIKDKLNALVGSLRREGHITTEQVYAAVAGLRSQEVEALIAAVDGRDSAGRIHWSRLRDALFEEEIRNLHARLARLFVNAGAKENA